MKNETVWIAVVALIVGLLGGYLISSISATGKNKQESADISSGAVTPTDYVGRITETEKIVAQEPKNLKAWISLGNDYFDTEQHQKAINSYGKALEIEPNNPNVLTDQGVMFRKMGWYDKALANFEKALKIEPNHLQSLYNMGVIFSEDLKQPDKAIPFWTKYLKIDPNSATASQIKGLLEKMGPGPQPVVK